MPAIASPAESERIADELEVFFYDVVSHDGTRLRAWTNDPDCRIDGPTVLLCNGLATNAWSAPALLDPECGVRVVSLNHHGVGGSERPVDPERVGIDAFVEDAIAVMDDAGIVRAPVMGWSMPVARALTVSAARVARRVGKLITPVSTRLPVWPITFVAGRWDVLAGARDMATAAARIEGATYVELRGTHFIAMEQPERVHGLLLEFLERVS